MASNNTLIREAEAGSKTSVEMEYALEKNSEEMDAAAALTSLVAPVPIQEVTEQQQPTTGATVDKEETIDKDFVIPQRFTKSGRKRAVPFPLKVGLSFAVLLNWHYLVYGQS